ncbi:MAG: hypothetical protein JWO88_2137 [Frankiales bacterium]|nr:hypothetical protein [Frankiales bacterium]
MTDKLDDVWITRDFPVLVEVTRRMDQGERLVMAHKIAETLGRDAGEVGLAVLPRDVGQRRVMTRPD